MKNYLYWALAAISSGMMFYGMYSAKADLLSKNQTLVFVIGGLIATTVFTLLAIYSRTKQINTDTQRKVTDLELLQMFEQQPGGILNSAQIAEKTELSKHEAQTRLSSLAMGGLLTTGVNAMGTKYYYELPTALEKVEGLTLSDDPFITLEDLQQIFEAYDYRVSPHDIMMATKLPWKVISLEMQYFRKQGIIDVVRIARPGDAPKQYVLHEDYHLSAGLDLDSRTRINAEVKQLLYDERHLV